MLDPGYLLALPIPQTQVTAIYEVLHESARIAAFPVDLRVPASTSNLFKLFAEGTSRQLEQLYRKV